MSFINQSIEKNQIVTIVKDPLIQFYYDFSYKINNFDNLEYLYYNIAKIDIDLYNNDKIINIPPLKSSDDKLFFQYYFNIDLLINYNIDIINFEFSIDIIKNIIKLKIKDSSEIKKIILSKIVIDLINSYEGFNLNSDELKDINIKTSLDILKNSCDIFKKMNIEIKNNIKNIKLEEIYIKIIISLIENRKLEDYNYAYDIIEQLNLEYINLTKNMIEKLLQLLNSEESFIKDYIILNYNDLLDVKKINFYYILLKYILKNSFYIYQIPFLLKTRYIIIKAIKEKNNNTEFKEKVKYIIKILSDSSYYIKKYSSKELKDELDDSKNNNFNSNKAQSHITGETFNQSHSNDKDVNSIPPDESYSLELTELNNFEKDVIKIIKEISNDFIIISGDKYLAIYNYEYHKLKSLSFKETIYNIFEVNKNNKNALSFIVNFEKNHFYEYEFLIKDDNNIQEIPKNKNHQNPYSLFYLEINEKNIFCGEGGIIYDYPNFFTKITDNNLNKTPIYEDPIFGGIKIEDDYAVLISKNLKNSNFKLIVINLEGNKLNKLDDIEIKDNSLNLSPNCLSFLKINNEKNKILVLCACETKDDKINGFLYFILGDNKLNFHETDFKVNCFCQLLKFQEVFESNSNENKNYNIEVINYFLVGGIKKDESKERGIIKLLKYNDNTGKIKNGNEITNDFNKPISCIYHYRRNQSILISCKNENYYVCERIYKKDNNGEREIQYLIR